MGEPAPTESLPHGRTCPRAGLGVALAALAVAACIEAVPVSRERSGIVNGTPVTYFAYREVVAVIQDYGYVSCFSCSATLISSRIVLTAGHCVVVWDSTTGPTTEVLAPTTLGVFIGNDARQAKIADTYRVGAVHLHPSYDPYEGVGDIALLELTADVPAVTPAPILSLAEAQAVSSGTTMLIVGYGNTISSELINDGVKYYGRTPFVSMGSTYFVAGTTGMPVACNGDSGGPAFLERGTTRSILGVTSGFANWDAPCSDGNIFTLAPAYLDWIVSTVGPLDPSPAPGPSDGGVPPNDAGQPGAADGPTWEAGTSPGPSPDGGSAGLDSEDPPTASCAVSGSGSASGGFGWLVPLSAGVVARRRPRRPPTNVVCPRGG